MRSCSLLFLAALAVGCAATGDETGAGESDFTSGPEGLAQWLGASHSVKFMGQFLDWRAGARTPFTFGALRPDLASPSGISFPAAVFESREVDAMMQLARQADQLALPISTGEPAKVELADLVCAAAPGIHVYGGRASWLGDRLAHGDFAPEDPALVDGAVQASTTEVMIAFPGVDTSAPMLRLAFAIVERPLSNKPDAPVGSYWTILGASLGEPRCAARTQSVFSLSTQNDNLLTINAGEKDALIASGAWHEQTRPGREGFALGVADGPGRIGIYRCFYPGYGLHFVSASATCEGGTQEGLLGFAAQTYAPDAPRSLRRCLQSYNQFTHVLGGACDAGARDDGVLAWVP